VDKRLKQLIKELANCKQSDNDYIGTVHGFIGADMLLQMDFEFKSLLDIPLGSMPCVCTEDINSCNATYMLTN
jgi:hypothetical protein